MSNLPVRLDQITEELAASQFDLELATTNYKQILTKAHGFKCTKENVKEGNELLQSLRNVRGQLEKAKKEKKAPITAAGKAIEGGYRKIDGPLAECETMIQQQVVNVNNALEKERQDAIKENARIIRIKDSIPIFVNETAKQIIQATSDNELVRLQKLIGSEKSRSTFYQEFLDEFKTACDGLTPLINQRKDYLRQEAASKAELAKATADGDAFKQVEIREKMETLNAELGENVIKIQEKAFAAASSIETVVGEPLVETIKPYRTQWKWRVDNINLLAKKLPGCVKLVVDETAVDVIFAEKKVAGEFKGEGEIEFNGIIFYLHKFI
jgi:hypothetical protein